MIVRRDFLKGIGAAAGFGLRPGLLSGVFAESQTAAYDHPEKDLFDRGQCNGNMGCVLRV